MRELRINATLPLPDDMLEQSEMIARLKPAFAAFSEAFGTKVDASVVKVGARSAKAAPAPVVVEDKIREPAPPPEAVHHQHKVA